jgi:hypothetical protein
MPFAGNTRHKYFPLDAKIPGFGGIGRWTIDKAGILAGIWLEIRGTAAGTLSGLNALGFSSIIRQVRLYLSTGVDICMFSGPGYFYLMKDYIEDYKDPCPSTSGKTAISAIAYNLDMYIPISINTRDAPGLILLQQERVTCMLSVEVEALATIATGLTDGGPTITPHLEVFTVPPAPADRPPLNLVHSWMEETQVNAASSGDLPYIWPRGNTILRMLHGYGFAASGADNWTKGIVRVQQNDRIYECTPNQQDMTFARAHGRARPLGTIAFDMFGSSGLGSFGSARDALVTQDVTNVKSIITVSAAKTLYSLRNEIVAVKEPEAAAQ